MLLIGIFSLNAAEFDIADFTIDRGSTYTASVNLTDTEGVIISYSGFQFDISLPDEITVKSITTGNLLADFTLEQKKVSANKIRVIAFSDGKRATNIKNDIVNIVFQASDNVFTGKGLISLTTAMVSDPKGEDIILSDSDTEVTFNVAVSNITLSADDLTLLKGQTDKLKATVEPGETTFNTVTWTSASPEVASVETDGTVKALSAGTAVITATCGEVSATCTVTVKAGGDITIKPGDGDGGDGGGGSGGGDGDDDQNNENGWVEGNDIFVRLNRSITINATMPEGLDETPVLEWKLAEGGQQYVLLTVSENTLSATFKGIELGETSYTLSCNGTELLNGKVTVLPIEPKSIELSAQNLTLLKGQTDKLTATVEPEETTFNTVTWTSASPEVASVESDGTITALSAGTAVITATCGEVSTTCTVTVKAGGDITIKPGDGDGGDGGGGSGGGDDDDDSKAGWVNGKDVTVKVNRTLTIEIGLPDDLSETPVFEWKLADGGSRYVTLTPGDDTLTASFTGKEVGITSYTLLLAGEELLTGKVTVIDKNSSVNHINTLPKGEILAIYSVQGQYVGKDPSVMSKGIYIVRTTSGTIKLVR